MPGAIWRVTDRTTMTALQGRGPSARRRRRSGPLQVSFVSGGAGAPPRIAFAIGRKVGGAVVRNQLRRRLRAVLAEQALALAPGAYLVGAQPEAAALTFDELRTHVLEAIRGLR